MSDYSYNLHISSSNPEDIEKAVELLKAEDVISDTFFSIDSWNVSAANGGAQIWLSTEDAPRGYVKCWREEEHNTVMHDLAQQIPSVLIELSGKSLDDPFESEFKKQYHGDMIREASVDRDAKDEILDSNLQKAPWRSFGTSEVETSVEENNLRTVFILTCVHETKFGTSVYGSAHATRDEALAHVDEIKLKCDFDESAGNEYFNYDLDTQVLDISKLALAHAPEKTVVPSYFGISLDIPKDYDKSQPLDVKHHMEDSIAKLKAIPWDQHAVNHRHSYVSAANLIAVYNLEDSIAREGIKGWALDNPGQEPERLYYSPYTLYEANKKGMEQTMDKLVSFAREVMPLNNGRDNDELSTAVDNFKRMNIRRGDKDETRGFVYATDARSFEGSVLSMRGYLGVVCQAYAQFLFKQIEKDLGHDPRVPVNMKDKSFMEALVAGDVQPEDATFYTDYWHSTNVQGSLQEFLGMNSEEYGAWIKVGDSVLSSIAEARREGKAFEAPKTPFDEALAAAKAKAEDQAKEGMSPGRPTNEQSI